MLSALNLLIDSEVNIRYAKNFTAEEPYKLLEVDEGMLKEMLENGLSVKGGPNEEAVICTSTATYAMKFVSTSNTVLLIPPSESPYFSHNVADHDSKDESETTGKRSEIGVVATASGHIELVETSPKLEVLKDLLSRRPLQEDLDGEAEDMCGEEGLYTWDNLLRTVQASELQLRAGLKSLEAVEIGGYWRVLDSAFMHSLLEILLLTAIQYDWPLDALVGSEVVRVLAADNFSPRLIIHCLETYGFRTNSQHSQETTAQNISEGDVSQTWTLDENKVCLHFGKRLLAARAKWKLEEFLEEWSNLVPTGMHPHLDMLKGEALVDKIGIDSWLHLYSCSLLPMTPDARFSLLFKRRPKWELEDLMPYLRDLKVPGQSVEAMLLKYTRKTQPTPTAVPLYTAR